MLSKKHIEKITGILRKYPVKQASIFGSYATGNFHENSDVDILIEYEYPVSILLFVKIKNELEKVLNKPVDLVSKDALKPKIKDRILREQQVIYHE